MALSGPGHQPKIRLTTERVMIPKPPPTTVGGMQVPVRARAVRILDRKALAAAQTHEGIPKPPNENSSGFYESTKQHLSMSHWRKIQVSFIPFFRMCFP